MTMPPNGPQHPGYGDAPPPPPNGPQYLGYGTPRPHPPAPKKRNPWLVGCLGCGGIAVAGLVALAIVGAVTGAGKGTSNTATPPTDVAASTPASGAPAKPKPKPKPHTVLTESGTGTKSTKTFRVHGDWDLQYSYNCSNFGSAGNFQVWGDGGIDVYVNELERHNTDVTHEHHGGGSMALKINSECRWKIKVVQLP
jgi:hypothetical protein